MAPVKPYQRIKMPKRNYKERINDFSEVALGFDEEHALREASRCLQCPDPLCIAGCPAQIDIRSFIKCICDRDYEAAIKKIKEKNSLPGVCGRVCPQEVQCEKACILNKRNMPINIGALERFAADFELKENIKILENEKKYAVNKSIKIAIVGSGPSGLTVAGDLVKLGYDVTVFEGLHEFGGVLTYGIPEFRLPKKIVKIEINYIRRLGVDFQNDVIIGKTLTIDELFDQGYRAIFIGTGAGPPIFLNIPGEFFNGVYTANEFLTRCNLMNAYRTYEFDTPLFIGKKSFVIGGGNVAVDAARVALRAKAQEVSILYRRSRNEMPARIEEIENAEEEGIKMQFLKTPIRFNGKDGWVKSIECLKMKLGSFDASRRLKPLPIPGSNHILNADMVIIAIGRKPNPTIPQTTIGLKTNDGRICVDTQGRTTIQNVWAGGDVVTGEATVIQAIGAGKIAAIDMHKCLENSKSHSFGVS